MISRRDLIKSGAVGGMLAGATPAFACAQPSVDAFLLDTRFAASSLPRPIVAPVWRFAGDVTQVWYDHLDTRWRQPGFVLGGISGSDSLFVLETLANHHGRRVISRNTLEGDPGVGVVPVSWIIAPYHPSVRA